MKRLSFRIPALALVMVLFLSSATPAHAPAVLSSPKSMMYVYNWYTVPDDSFIDYETLSYEENEWIMILNTNCDTNPMGGTLIAKGYLRSNYPHITYPDCYLYSH
jgi:hypothetical protein